ncbi:hypothetical protein, partial [Nonomuraea dietziae]|uniref:hypothetical protein n=1 Tax=Nonomuraea dietziae TaxID=65515 RepID=UPI0031D5803B
MTQAPLERGALAEADDIATYLTRLRAVGRGLGAVPPTRPRAGGHGRRLPRCAPSSPGIADPLIYGTSRPSRPQQRDRSRRSSAHVGPAPHRDPSLVSGPQDHAMGGQPRHPGAVELRAVPV